MSCEVTKKEIERVIEKLEKERDELLRKIDEEEEKGNTENAILLLERVKEKQIQIETLKWVVKRL